MYNLVFVGFGVKPKGIFTVGSAVRCPLGFYNSQTLTCYVVADLQCGFLVETEQAIAGRKKFIGPIPR
jgi:hypothetical protein